MLCDHELKDLIGELDRNLSKLALCRDQREKAESLHDMLEYAHTSGQIMGLLLAKQALQELIYKSELNRQVELEKLNIIHGLERGECLS